MLDLLGEHDVAVAIVARKRSGSVGTYGELPDLKFLGGNSFVVGLNDRDFVQKPIRPAVLGNVVRAVGVENVTISNRGGDGLSSRANGRQRRGRRWPSVVPIHSCR